MDRLIETGTNMANRQIAKSRNRSMRRSARGFTIIEAALTTVIVGTGILAMVSAQQAYHMKNDWAARTGTAQMLANEIRETTLVLPLHDPVTGDANLGPEANELSVIDWDDVDDFAGTVDAAGVGSKTTFNPPINGLRFAVADLTNWQQVVTVENVLPDNINNAFTLALGTTDMMRVTVAVQYREGDTAAWETVTSMSWVVTE
jgi:hypothetical protein